MVCVCGCGCVCVCVSTDQKTSRAALPLLRIFLSPLFLFSACFRGSHCVCVSDREWGTQALVRASLWQGQRSPWVPSPIRGSLRLMARSAQGCGNASVQSDMVLDIPPPTNQDPPTTSLVTLSFLLQRPFAVDLLSSHWQRTVPKSEGLRVFVCVCVCGVVV